MRKLLLAGPAIGLAFLAAPAGAGELVTNGGFETGDFTGWTPVNDGGTAGCGVNVWTVNSTGAQGCSGLTPTPAPNDGTFAAYNTFDGDAVNYTLSQTLAIPTDAIGGTLSFEDTVHLNNNGNPRTVQFDIYDATNTTLLQTLYSQAYTTGSQGWTTFTADASAALLADAGETVTLRLTNFVPDSYAGPGGFGVDDISLNAVEAAPEPASLALLGAGLLGLARTRRRKS